MSRDKLSVVFADCREQGILVFLDEGYCSTTEEATQNEDTSAIGLIYAQTEDPGCAMTDILEEGSAVVEWAFEALDDDDTERLVASITSIFEAHGYEVDVDPDIETVSAVIEQADLPETFFLEWCSKNRVEESDAEDMDRIDPDSEVVFTKSEEQQERLFDSSDDESDSTGAATDDED